MILYLDASALVKCYIAEKHSPDVNAWIATAEVVVTSLVTRSEVAAAIGRVRRMKVIPDDQALAALETFREDWGRLQRLPVSEVTVERADNLAWELNLRGYDAIHLAAAILWQETLNLPVTIATFDLQLDEAAKIMGMDVLPE
jgi:uncharacterized protein